MGASVGGGCVCVCKWSWSKLSCGRQVFVRWRGSQCVIAGASSQSKDAEFQGLVKTTSASSKTCFLPCPHRLTLRLHLCADAPLHIPVPARSACSRARKLPGMTVPSSLKNTVRHEKDRARACAHSRQWRCSERHSDRSLQKRAFGQLRKCIRALMHFELR